MPHSGCFVTGSRTAKTWQIEESVAIKFEDNHAKGAPNQLKTEYDRPDLVGWLGSLGAAGGAHGPETAVLHNAPHCPMLSHSGILTG